MGKGPGPMVLGEAFWRVLWKVRNCVSFILLVTGVANVVLERARAAAGRRARGAGEDAESPARIAGTTALLAVVSDIVGWQPHIGLFAGLDCGEPSRGAVGEFLSGDPSQLRLSASPGLPCRRQSLFRAPQARTSARATDHGKRSGWFGRGYNDYVWIR